MKYNKKYNINSPQFRNKELVILRDAIDNAEKQKKKKFIDTPSIKNMIKIIEKFIKEKQLTYFLFMTNFTTKLWKFQIMIFSLPMHLMMLKNWQIYIIRQDLMK